MPRYKDFVLNNMSGGINVVDSPTDLVNLTGDKKKGSQALNIENFFPLRRGRQRTERGYETHKDLGTGSPITGIHKFYKSDGTEYFMVASGGTLYEMDETTKALTSVMTVDSTNYLDFETAYDNLVVCDGSNNARAWNGSTVTAITAGVPAAPIQSRFYLDTLFMYLDRDSLVYYSTAGDIFAGWPNNVISCDNDDGTHITGLEKLFIQGNIQTALVVGKDGALGVVLGSGTVADPFYYAQINEDAGVPGFRVMRQHNQDVSFLTNRGVSSYQLNKQDVNLGYTILTKKVFTEFLALDTVALKNSHVIYDWRNTRLRFFVPESGQTHPSVVWNYDTEEGGWYKSRYPHFITASFVDKNGTQWLGTSTGLLLKCDDFIYNFDGGVISSVYQTGYMDFGAPNLRKRLTNMEVFAQGQGNYGFGVSSSLDNGQRRGSSGTINLRGASYNWNEGVWTDDPNTYQWGAAPISLSRFIPGGYFKNMALEFNGNSADEPFDIFSVHFSVEYMDFR